MTAVAARGGFLWRYEPARDEIQLRGDAALRAAAALMPRLNPMGGSRKDVTRAVELLEGARDPADVFRQVAQDARWSGPKGFTKQGRSIASLSQPARLALEMASHEDAERRALEGELHVLAAAWRNAEEIAGIADDMFLPKSVEDDLARLKRGAGR